MPPKRYKIGTAQWQTSFIDRRNKMCRHENKRKKSEKCIVKKKKRKKQKQFSVKQKTRSKIQTLLHVPVNILIKKGYASHMKSGCWQIRAQPKSQHN